MRRRTALVGPIVAAMAVGACGAGDGPATDASNAAVTAPAVSLTTATAGSGSAGPSTAPDQRTAVPEALAFTAPLLDGATFDGAALAGGTVAFWFWSPY